MSKFLVLNPNPTELDTVLTKSNFQNEKNGPFDATFLLGDVIPATVDALPTVDVGQTTYFSEGKHGISLQISSSTESDVNSQAVKPNLNFLLLHVNIITLKSKLTVMYVSGAAETNENHESVLKQMRENTRSIDILITYDWPLSIARNQNLMLVGSRFVDEITKTVKPRYHFAVGQDAGKFLEFPPFQWENGSSTRFISLGQEGSGEKWFYAFSMTKEIPPSTTGIEYGANPFDKPIGESLENSNKRLMDADIQNVVAKKPKVISSDQCFFCLSNPNVETHMIISIGSHSYLTVAKGPLTRSNKNLPFSGHAIIIPIEHIPSIRKENTSVADSPIYKEIKQFQNALVKSFIGNKTNYKLVSFEIDLKTNIHKHVQILPIPEYLIDKFGDHLTQRAELNNEKFAGKNHNLKFEKFNDDSSPELIDIINSSDHMIFTLHNSENEKTIYVAQLPDKDKTMVDLQFPRRVLANLLNLPKRVYWERCKQPKFKESQDCEEFKKFFHKFDFTLE